MGIGKRIRAVLFRNRLERSLEDELRSHLDMCTEDNIAAGLTPEEASRQARVAFGGKDQAAEECRDVRGGQWLESVLQDARFGFRTMRKDRGYTVAAILALGLGIGANTALFTLFDSVVLRPLPISDPARVVELYRSSPRISFGPFSYADYLYYRDHQTAFTGITMAGPAGLRMSGASAPAARRPSTPSSVLGFAGPERIAGGVEPVTSLFVSADYFSVFGVNPILGRPFQPEDRLSASPPFAVLLSENFWQRRFDRDPNILGKELMFSGISTVVVGITPLDFKGTRPHVPDVWLPEVALQDPRRRPDRSLLCCELQARLKPGQTLQQAQAQMTALADAMRQEFAETDPQAGVTVEPARTSGWRTVRGYGLLYLMLQPAIGLVLLIACANVAGLLLGRAAARRREIAVRLALGASRGRLIRQLLTESILMAQLAGGVSLLVTWWTLHTGVKLLLSALTKSGLSDAATFPIDVTPNARIFLYTLAVATLTGVIFALAPALQATRPGLVAALKEEGGTLASRKSRLRAWLVATQIAVCLMLIIGAGMLVRSSVRLLGSDPGFETKNVLSVSVLNPSELGYNGSRTEQLHRELQERLRALPGVRSIAEASRVPLGGNVSFTTAVPQGSAAAHDLRAVGQLPIFPYSLVSQEYFETLGIPLLSGRGFTPDEIARHAPVAVISEGLARQLWPGEDTIGKRITIGSPTQTHFSSEQNIYSESSEVIGVAREICSESRTAPDAGALYLPRPNSEWDTNLLVRINGDPARVAAALAGEIQALDRNLAASYQTLENRLTAEGGYVITRLGGMVFGLIGALGLFLASIGIYSMVGYLVSQQTREIGIRMAMGAQRSDVLRLVMLRSMGPIGSGLAAGAILGVLLSRVLSSLLQGLKLLDPVLIAGISLVLAAIALAAAYLPARRATKLDPAAALRFE